jgi:hypothetical protein
MMFVRFAGTVDLVEMLVFKASTVNKDYAVRPSFFSVQGSLVCFGLTEAYKLVGDLFKVL